jgi:hypothetical protein
MLLESKGKLLGCIMEVDAGAGILEFKESCL